MGDLIQNPAVVAAAVAGFFGLLTGYLSRRHAQRLDAAQRKHEAKQEEERRAYQAAIDRIESKLKEAEIEKTKAETARVYTTTARELMEDMQRRIDHLEQEVVPDLHRTIQNQESEIRALEARLDEANKYAERIGRLQHEVGIVRAENERLRKMLPGRHDDGDPDTS